jgi:hypothetical protein
VEWSSQFNESPTDRKPTASDNEGIGFLHAGRECRAFYRQQGGSVELACSHIESAHDAHGLLERPLRDDYTQALRGFEVDEQLEVWVSDR